MISLLVKYTAMIFCSLHLFMKLLHIVPSKKVYLSQILFLLFILPVVYTFRKYAAPFSILIIVMLLAFFINNVLKTPLSLSVTVSSIAFGIVYFAFLIAALLVSPIGCFLDIYLDSSASDIISMICIGMIQFLLISIPFKLHRFNNGMTFLSENGSNDIGVYVSLSILLTASFLSIPEKPTLILIIPLFYTLLCGLSILFWWRSSLTKRYLHKLKDMEIEELQKKISENHQEIEKLKYHNDELSKIIHKDNKLIPAMEYAVREYLLSAKNLESYNDLFNYGKEILIQLESISLERKGILNDYETKNKKLALTNILSIDTLLSYMFQKAKENHISFDVSLSESMKYLVNHMIEESDLRTLLADLIDNAIIASRNSIIKNILINMGFSDTYYSIEVFDSGEPFHEGILLSLGIKQATTHLKEGGSGIGLMTAFEIINRSQASFIIEEFEDNNLFTKKVSIRFDNLKQIRIKTIRTNIKKLLSKRVDIIIH